MYDDTKPWEKNLPADLLPATKALRKSFDDAHWSFGLTTQRICYSQLHQDAVHEELSEYVRHLQHLKIVVGPAATQHFRETFAMGTPPAIFKAFYDLYIVGVSLQSLAIFKELIEIGRVNEARLNAPHLEWAHSMTMELVKYHAYRIEMWVKDVCDKHVYDPNEDSDEMIYWRKWQAPMLIVMKPSRYMPYDPATVWERNDIETSQRWLESFAENYVIHLQIPIDRFAGQFAVELAKQPKTMQHDATGNDPQPASQPVVTSASTRATPTNARREANKLETHAKYKSWRKEYRSLKQSHPDQSDVWYSLKIAKMVIAKGSSSETIRKHMKRK